MYLPKVSHGHPPKPTKASYVHHLLSAVNLSSPYVIPLEVNVTKSTAACIQSFTLNFPATSTSKRFTPNNTLNCSYTDLVFFLPFCCCSPPLRAPQRLRLLYQLRSGSPPRAWSLFHKANSELFQWEDFPSNLNTSPKMAP